jgi:hypothetical protein
MTEPGKVEEKVGSVIDAVVDVLDDGEMSDAEKVIHCREMLISQDPTDGPIRVNCYVPGHPGGSRCSKCLERGSVLDAVSAPQTREPTMPIEFELQVVKDGKVESVPHRFFPDSEPPLVKALRERDEARAIVMRARLPEDTIKTLAQKWLAERNPEQGWPSRIERFNAAYYSENNEVVTRLLVDFYNYAEGKAESPIPPK